MSYVTYTTDALVCGAYNRNTADRSFLLFTREAGMLYAEARSIREERSRQRYALQEFSQIRVSLIKGKQSWKVGSVEVLRNDYTEALTREARGSVTALYKTLRRFIHGEEASPKLFDFCVEALVVLSGETPERAFVESLCQVRILTDLGYVDATELASPLATVSVSDMASLYTKERQNTCATLINRATLNSQL